MGVIKWWNDNNIGAIVSVSLHPIVFVAKSNKISRGVMTMSIYCEETRLHFTKLWFNKAAIQMEIPKLQNMFTLSTNSKGVLVRLPMV